jgi:hypothetical protein
MCMGPAARLMGAGDKAARGLASSSSSTTNTQLTPPPPTKTAAVVKPAGRRGSTARKSKRRGTSQLTVRRPSMGGSYTGSGVNLPT